AHAAHDPGGREESAARGAESRASGEGRTARGRREEMMRYRVLLLGLAVYGCAFLRSQGNSGSTLLRRDAFPPQLRSAVDALGDRVVKPGKERVVTTGVLT